MIHGKDDRTSSADFVKFIEEAYELANTKQEFRQRLESNDEPKGGA